MGKEKRRRTHGSGSVYARGKTWWIKYYDSAGERQFESSKSGIKADAESLLRIRLGEVAAGTHRLLQPQAATVSDCMALVVADYRLHRRASLADVEQRISKHLKPAFGWLKAAEFTTKHAEIYIRDRRKAKAAEATINRELAIVRRGLKLAARETPPWILHVPYVPQLSEDNVRTGFLSPSQYGALKEELPSYLKPVLCYAYYTGLRRGALLRLRLNQIDLEQGLIWVSMAQTKNRRGHAIPVLNGEMRAYAEMALSGHKAYLFERDGQPIRSFKTAWNNATARAGMPDLHFHDLRRTAIRDWIATGTQEETVMAVSGHKTRSMLTRYNILEGRDIQQAARRREEFEATAMADKADQLGTNLGTALNLKPS
jgi:integrase